MNEIELIYFTVAGMGLFWFCAGNLVANTRMCLLLLGSSYTALRPFLLLTPPVSGLGLHKHL